MTISIPALIRSAARKFHLRNQVRKLRAIDDHILADMGLTRSAIEYAVRNGDPRR